MKQWSWDDQGFGYDVLSLTKNLIQIKQIWSKMVLILPNVIISLSLPICVQVQLAICTAVYTEE